MNTYEELETWAFDQLEDTYDLCYIGMYDQLTDEMIEALIDGDELSFDDLVFEWAREEQDDNAWDIATEIVQRIESLVEQEVWDEHEAELMDSLRERLVLDIHERDNGVDIEALMRNTPDIEVMVPLIDSYASLDGGERNTDQIIEALGVEYTDNNHKAARQLIDNCATDQGMMVAVTKVSPLALHQLEYRRSYTVYNPIIAYGDPSTGATFLSLDCDNFPNTEVELEAYGVWKPWVSLEDSHGIVIPESQDEF